MPKTEVVLYAEDNGTCTLLDWMDGLPQKAQDKCIVRIERLAEMGHELRRPEADFLRDGVFSENKAVISHGLIKKGEEVPAKQIDLAIERKGRFVSNPLKHTYVE